MSETNKSEKASKIIQIEEDSYVLGVNNRESDIISTYVNESPSKPNLEHVLNIPKQRKPAVVMDNDRSASNYLVESSNSVVNSSDEVSSSEDVDSNYNEHELVLEYTKFKTEWSNDPLSHYKIPLNNICDMSFNETFLSRVIIPKILELCANYLSQLKQYQNLHLSYQIEGYQELKYAILYSRNKVLLDYFQSYFEGNGILCMPPSVCYVPVNNCYKGVGTLQHCIRELLGTHVNQLDVSDLLWIEKRCAVTEFKNPNRGVIGFKNGIYDMSSGWFYSGNADCVENIYFVDKIFPVDYSNETNSWLDIVVPGMDEWANDNFQNKDTFALFYAMMGFLLYDKPKWNIQINIVCKSFLYLDSVLILFRQIFGTYVVDETSQTANQLGTNKVLVFKLVDLNYPYRNDETETKYVTVSGSAVSHDNVINIYVNRPIKRDVNIECFILKSNRAYLDFQSQMPTLRDLRTMLPDKNNERNF